MTERPNCLECRHRRPIPGNAHSMCVHPSTLTIQGDAFSQAMAIFGRGGPMPSEIGVAGHPHGIARGWFAWPFNYDPVWLLSCNGFEPKP